MLHLSGITQELICWFFFTSRDKETQVLLREANQILTRSKLPSEHERRLRPLAIDLKSKELKVTFN